MVVTAESLPSYIQSWVTLCFQQILPVKCRLPLPNTHHSIGQGGGGGRLSKSIPKFPELLHRFSFCQLTLNFCCCSNEEQGSRETDSSRATDSFIGPGSPSATVAGQRAQRILSLASQGWDYRHTPQRSPYLFTLSSKIKTRSLYFCTRTEPCAQQPPGVLNGDRQPKQLQIILVLPACPSPVVLNFFYDGSMHKPLVSVLFFFS